MSSNQVCSLSRCSHIGTRLKQVLERSHLEEISFALVMCFGRYPPLREIEGGAAFGLEKQGLFVSVVGNGERFGWETAVLPDEITARQPPQVGSGLGNVKKLGKNGRFAEDNSWKGNGRYSLKILGNHQCQNWLSLWASLRAKALEIVAQKEKMS